MNDPSDEDCAKGTRDWPHAPPHRLGSAGVYFVTARTSGQVHLLAEDDIKDWFQEMLFVLAAEFMTIGSITDRLLNFCNAFVGRFRGGLAHVNVVQSIIFAGMSGSALADAASSGKLMQKMMTQDGKYTASFAAALTAASSVIVTSGLKPALPSYRRCSGLCLTRFCFSENPPQRIMSSSSSIADGARYAL